jgi:DMSO/TMAO reductase YedYZ molybdopterin-dependent catalytic subunit
VRPGAVEVLFDGADTPLGTMPDFQRSIPISKALDPNTLLAFAMNGETLPVKHGFPLRAVVPGWTGSAWVKWLMGIQVLDQPASGFWMKSAYLHPGRPVAPGAVVPAEAMTPVTSLRVKSVIFFPEDGTKVEPGKRIAIRGAAWAGDRGRVTRVEISVDRGRSWRPARLTGQATRFGWRLWDFPWTPADDGHYTILARARDASGEVQPLIQEWNPAGYLWNAVSRVDVNVPASETPLAQAGPPPAGFREACLTCHSDDVIRQQRLSRAQWEREINKMINWGARIRQEDRETFLDYLSK